MANTNWKTIAADLSRRIESGELGAGARISSGEDLATKWGVSRHTAHRAIEELQRQGLVVRQRRWGTVVAGPESRERTGRVAFLADRNVQRYNFPEPDLIRGIRDGLGEAFHLVVLDSKDDPAQEARQLERIRDEVDGVIAYPTSDPRNNTVFNRLHDAAFPLVVLDRYPEGLRVDAVVSDNESATQTAMRALHDQGHRQIGFFSFWKPDFSSVVERHRGYAAAQVEIGVEDHASTTRWFHRDLDGNESLLVQSVHDALFTLLRSENPITALFCVEDLLAAAVLQACDSIGFGCPDDLALALFNDWPPMMLRRPWGVHRIVKRHYELGLTAARLLTQRMDGAVHDPEIVRVPADVLVADSGLTPALLGGLTP